MNLNKRITPFHYKKNKLKYKNRQVQCWDSIRKKHALYKHFSCLGTGIGELSGQHSGDKKSRMNAFEDIGVVSVIQLSCNHSTPCKYCLSHMCIFCIP